MNTLLAKYWRNPLGRWLKSRLRPVKHLLFGRAGIHRALSEMTDVKYVVDVGAASGEYVNHYKHAFPEAIVCAIEPIQHPRADEVKRVAVSDSEGERVIYVADEPDASGFYSKGKPLTVRVSRLDNLVGGPIDLLKIDVEGNELNVLKGATESLKRTKYIYIEITRNHWQCLKLLEEAGSVLKWTDDNNYFYAHA